MEYFKLKKFAIFEKKIGHFSKFALFADAGNKTK